MLKKILIISISIGFGFIAFLFYWRSTSRPGLQSTSPRVYRPTPALSPQEMLALLEHFNAAAAKRDAKLKSGIIEFSVTISKIKTPFSKKPVYEKRLKWDITYRFSGQQQFYQIVESVRVKPGSFRRATWKESKRYEFQEDRNQRHGRVNRGDGWQWTSHHPVQLGDYHKPFRWKWDANLTQITRMFGSIVDAQNIVEDEPYIKLEEWHADKIKTTELWFDRRKDYRATRTLQQTVYPEKSESDRTLLNDRDLPYPGVLLSIKEISPQTSRIEYICQLAQFNPDIWFPQTVTEVWELVNLENSRFQDGRKLELQVHTASFNIPIAVKDLHLFPDR